MGSSNRMGWICQRPCGVAAEPLERAGVLGVGRAPAGAQGEIDPAVAIDVVRLDAHVIPSCRSSDDVVLAPAWVLVPDDRILGHGHHVELVVAVHVGGRDGVADLAGMRIDLLASETWGIRPRLPRASIRGWRRTSKTIGRMAVSGWLEQWAGSGVVGRTGLGDNTERSEPRRSARVGRYQAGLWPGSPLRSRNAVAACMMASSVAWARGISAVIRPSQRTMIRSETASSSGSSLEVMMMARPWDGQPADQLVDLGLGADVDAAGGLVEQQDLGLDQEPAGEDALLLVAAREAGDRNVAAGRLDRQLLDRPGHGAILGAGRRAGRRSARGGGGS